MKDLVTLAGWEEPAATSPIGKHIESDVEMKRRALAYYLQKATRAQRELNRRRAVLEEVEAAFQGALQTKVVEHLQSSTSKTFQEAMLHLESQIRDLRSEIAGKSLALRSIESEVNRARSELVVARHSLDIFRRRDKDAATLRPVRALPRAC